MSANKQVAQREPQAVQGKGEEPALVPAVDIYEDDHGITVQADMPGVAKERLNIQADRNSLLIEGEAAIDTPVGVEALYLDVPVTRFRRSFVLSAELEPDRIEANLKDGLLTVRIPKRAEYRPRKIEVQTS